MFVARIKLLKEEIHSLSELKDLEDLVINTMGEDAWNAIMYFHESKIQELKESEVYVKEDIKDYDLSLTALRSGINEEIETIKKLINKVNEAKRLDRRSLNNELRRIIIRLENNEGYF
ncbi:hypothetical protein [Clostridium botulinum]|uniref:Uncharacterized protein n=2 Tax=Clostridium botulinum TaxID=1491 RepID=C1FS27_CLOBJ|nr:hypothetical protein [Clostridium botulinum]ACO86034.1 conserved hypothetical protein [Clostridium botulinum A2 str. Kyoto]AUN07540.1 hypothetical protein RSJ14_12900 [Clostridium botulinum]MBN3367851.1 hypothetical protein [Clostridium botulinum]MBN3368292.1 hypothetical protein [Clostridium botulinum]MBN3375231.1 hypothetical protein [Clostridium botulinum]